MAIRVGLNGHDPVLYLLSTLGILEDRLAAIGEEVDWVAYSPGPRAPWLLGESLDFVGCGQTPMLFAHDDGVDAVYVASSPNRPRQGALLVRADGPIHTPADLAGHKVVYHASAWTAQLVAGALAQDGLRLDDITAVEPGGDQDLTDLLSGNISAATIIGPRLIQAEETGLVRRLVPTDSAVCNRHLFTTTRVFATEQQAVLREILTSMELACRWVLDHPEEAAGRRATETRYDAATWGGDARTWLQIFQRMPWAVASIDDAFICQQDRHTGLFADAGLLSGKASAREHFIPRLADVVRDAVDTAHRLVVA
ncbi:ABC transporter substrate-binding protein [Gordonia desulfuricans]|uniref:ABC transporter substrate-binding protein n=1 Tax=Gordonia desulfuricans TaxID=89051 RepID=A0A7K3LSS0_9ACTN|nr:ABC transporter substrate-binding protein [Gordonia desulfuricans]NDK91334.1 ABC transporter substrate-binding protein [Gordonia desulfuricans]